MESNIPQEIQDRIDKKADKYGFQVPFDGTNNFYNDDKVKGFQDGGLFGYSLALPEISALKAEVERLRGALEKIASVEENVSEDDIIISLSRGLGLCTTIANEAINSQTPQQ